jgi:hypothetical protein
MIHLSLFLRSEAKRSEAKRVQGTTLGGAMKLRVADGDVEADPCSSPGLWHSGFEWSANVNVDCRSVSPVA